MATPWDRLPYAREARRAGGSREREAEEDGKGEGANISFQPAMF
ncbi:MAG: hypothetical protein Q8O41_01980 [Candidatus Methanoperedens sp.]|nr:hypothetical protein [Candidatus Methanoperedens sp.]